jgi:hypothetical protein
MGKSTSAPSIPNPWTFHIESDPGTALVVDSESSIGSEPGKPLLIDSVIGSDPTRPLKIDSDSLLGSDPTKPLKIDTDSLLGSDPAKPLKIDTDSKIDSKSLIDLKPVAVDSCQTIKLAPLPPICVEQPYSQHFGITFMGMELWGFNMSGKSEMFLHSPPRSYHQGPPHPHDRECEPESTASRRKPGIRVRVGGKDTAQS